MGVFKTLSWGRSWLRPVDLYVVCELTATVLCCLFYSLHRCENCSVVNSVHRISVARFAILRVFGGSVLSSVSARQRFRVIVAEKPPM